MVREGSGEGKDRPCFRWPKWTKDSPEWQQVDTELPAEDPARAIDAFVETLDLSGLYASYSGRGQKAHRPDLMLKVVLYTIYRGRNRPCDWYRDAKFDRVSQWLGMGISPSRSRWYAFAGRLAPWVDAWNAEVLQVAIQEGVTTASRAALDGSTVAANATRHKLVNKQTIHQRLESLAEAVAEDQAGNRLAIQGRWMASTPQGRLRQYERYRCLDQQMRLRQEENQKRPPSERTPPEKVVLSPGDPEAVLGRDKQRVFRPLYTVQLMDDLDSPLILAYDVFAQASDAGTVGTMLERHLELTGKKPQVLLGDTKYASTTDLAICETAGVVFYGPYQENESKEVKQGKSAPPQIPKSEFRWLADQQTYECPQGHRLNYLGSVEESRAGGQTVTRLRYRCPARYCRACPRQPHCTRNLKAGREITRWEHEELIEALKARMQTAEAKALYRVRSQTVELAFADVKEHRRLRRFSGRGRACARTQLGLQILAHNGVALIGALVLPRGPPEAMITQAIDTG